MSCNKHMIHQPRYGNPVRCSRSKLFCMPAQKLRKDGTPKRSGLQEGDRRMGRALSLKLQVVDEYRLRQRQKADGQCCAPLCSIFLAVRREQTMPDVRQAMCGGSELNVNGESCIGPQSPVA